MRLTIMLALFGVGEIALHFGWYVTGILFLVISMGFLRDLRLKGLSARMGSALALVGVLLVCGAMLSTTQVQLPYFNLNPLPFGDMKFWVPLGLWAWVAALRTRPMKNPVGEEYPRVLVWSCLATILGVGLLLRLYHFHEPYTLYWDDTAISMTDARNASEISNYYFIFPFSNRQPFYQYLAILGCGLFPAASNIVLQRVLWAGLDLVTLWLTYLLGKETGGRRLGLLMALFGAVSKPLLVDCLTGHPSISAPLGIALCLLTTFRFVHRSSVSRAVSWGLSIGFLAYCYQTSWTYLGLVPLLMGAWIQWIRKKGLGGRWDNKNLGMTALMGCGWIVWFLSYMGYLPSAPGTSPKLIGILWIILAGCLFAFERKNPDPAGFRERERWVLGLGVASIFMFPMVTDPRFAEHIHSVSVFHPNGHLAYSAETWGIIRNKIVNFIQYFFTSGADHSDMSVPGEAFFSPNSQPLAILALAWVLARPTAVGAFLSICVAGAVLPQVMSIDPHTGKLLGLVTPLDMMAGLGILLFKDLFFIGRLRRGGRILLAMGMAVYLVWGAQLMYRRFYVWLPTLGNGNTITYSKVAQDSGHARVFLYQNGGIYTFQTQCILDDGLGAHWLGDQPEILDLEDGEAPWDIVVYVADNQSAAVARLKREYPEASWEGTRTGDREHGNGPILWRVFIRSADIPESKGKGGTWFQFHQVPKGWWHRKLFAFFGGPGLARGLIWVEDRIPRLEEPYPVDAGAHTASIEGAVSVPVDGNYTWKFTSANHMVIDVDGRELFYKRNLTFDNKPVGVYGLSNGEKTIFMKAGIHRILIRLVYQEEILTPRVTVRFPGEKADRRLDDLI